MEPIENNPFGAAWHPIHHAAQSGALSSSSFSAPLSPFLANLRTACGKTPLMLAAEHGHTDTLLLLLAHQAELEAATENEGFTPLIHAIRNNHTAAVHTLLSHGSDALRGDRWGRLPLFIAADHGHTASFLLLYHHLLQTQKREAVLEGMYSHTTLLMHACVRGHAGLVRELLGLGADPLREVEGKTAFDVVRKGECARLLAEWERGYVLGKGREVEEVGRWMDWVRPGWWGEGREVVVGEEKEEEDVVVGVVREVVYGVNDDVMSGVWEMLGKTTAVEEEEEEMEVVEEEEEEEEEEGDW